MRPWGTTLRITRDSGRQALRGRLLQRRRARAAIAREIAIEVVRLPEEDVVGVQLIALAAEPADRLQPVDELRLRLGAATLHLDRGGPRRDERRDLRGNGPLELDQRPAGRCRGDDLKEAANLTGVLRRGDLGREPLLEHERAIQARGLSARQHLGDQIELGIAGREQRR